jgi:hypothetical protein
LNNPHRRQLLDKYRPHTLSLYAAIPSPALTCGPPPEPRAKTLEDISLLQCAYEATQEEVLTLIEEKRLYGLGCGLVDIALLASTLLTPGASLWTLDKRLAGLAERFGVAYSP